MLICVVGSRSGLSRRTQIYSRLWATMCTRTMPSKWMRLLTLKM